MTVKPRNFKSTNWSDQPVTAQSFSNAPASNSEQCWTLLSNKNIFFKNWYRSMKWAKHKLSSWAPGPFKTSILIDVQIKKVNWRSVATSNEQTSWVKVLTGKPNARASPKSANLMFPLQSMRRFCGFKSRCRTLWLWQKAMPCSNWFK